MTPEVLVVGGVRAGSAAAYWVARRGRPVTLVETAASFGIQSGDRHPVEGAVVALSKTRVPVNRNPGSAEGELGGLDGTPQIGGEGRIDALVSPPLAEVSRLFPALLGEQPVEPSSGYSPFIVLAGGMRLEDDLQRNLPTISSDLCA